MGLSLPARTQPQSPERTSILIIEAANTLPRFFSRPSQVPTSLTHCTVELRIVDEVVGREVCAAITHPCVSSRLQPGLSRQCSSRRHREPRLPFTARRCSLNLHKEVDDDMAAYWTDPEVKERW